MSQRSTGPSRSVVVVEDDDLVRDLATCELEDAGFRVVGFSNADDALDHLALHAHDTAAVFTDVQMPGRLNGLELTAIVNRTWPAVQVLVTSGGALVNPVRLPGRVQFVPKPWRAADVVGRLRTLMGGPGVARVRLDAAML